MILAALIEYDVDGVTKYLGVTDGKYRDTTGVSLEDGLWYNALSSDVSWSESARHPYQEQGGELVVGDLVLANDGTFDFLMDADIVGMKVTLKRGDRDESWADMEQIFIARIAGRRFEGHSVIIELDNWLAKLSGPVFTDTFGSDTPNPQLVGKQIPYVLGKVTQAPVLLYDANNLTYYTAYNTSLIGEVTEGGNPTQKWYLGNQPTFNLKGSPTLPITATFEGPSNTAWTTIIDDDLNTWVTGSDTALTSPYTSQGNRPDGWTLIVGDTGSGVSVTQSGGMLIADSSGGGSVELTDADVTTVDARSVIVGSSSVEWSNASSAVRDDSGSATITTGGDKTDAIRVTSGVFESASVVLTTLHSITTGTPILESISLYENDELVYSEVLNKEIVGSAFVHRMSSLWDSISPDILGNETDLQIKLRDDSSSEFSLDSFYLGGEFRAAPSVHLRRDLSLTSGNPYSVTIEGTTTDGVSFAWGAHNSTSEDWPEHSEYAEFINQDSAEKVSSAFTLNSTITPSGSVFNLSYQPFFGATTSSGRRGDVTITRVKITEQSGGNKSYKGLAPHVIEQVGYTSSEYEQTTFDDHADEYGDPELGWLITKNETADQVLFRLAGSLNGYVWHGLDGKVRSKRLKAPTEVSDPFVIDSARANPAEIVAYDDPAPNLRKSVNALRNWQPLKTDDTAGITTTWTESDRAKVTTDWRITRAWEMGTDGKDEFTRRWPNVASREPFSTALRDATTCQLIANEGPDTWIQRPMFYEVPVQVDKGELSKVATGETVKAELDYPGLEDTWLLVMGRSGTATPGVVNLTLWAADQSPVALLAPYRFDPRITFTRNSTATYFDSSGVLQTAAVDEARLDYDPSDNSVKGWLFEEGRTNELLDNRDLSTGNWSNFGSATLNQDETGIDGSENTAWTITATATNSRPSQSISFGGNSRWSGSCFLKKNGSDSVRIRLIFSGGTTNELRLRVDTTDGSVSVLADSAGSSVHSVEDYGDWWRVVMTATDTGSNNEIIYQIYPDDTSGNQSVIYDFGQIEQGVHASSPIETGSSSVTRSADVAVIDGDSFTTLWNASAGSVIAEVIPAHDSESDEQVLSIDDGTTDERVGFRARSSGSYEAFGATGGTEQWRLFSTDSVQAGASARLALGFEANDIAYSDNGNSVSTDSSASMPSPSQMRIANGVFGRFNGHIHTLGYYPRRLTDSQIETASTVGRDLILDKV